MISKIILSTVLASSLMAQTPSINEKRIVVKLNEGHELPHSDLIKNSKHLFGNIHVVYSDDIFSLMTELSNREEVKNFDYDYKSATTELPKAYGTEVSNKSMEGNGNIFNDPKMSRLWGFRSATQNGMEVTGAYENFGNNTGEKVIVAVVDTGVDYNHEDLKDVMWVNEGEIPGNGIDDDGNGYIDDVHGIDTLDRDGNGNATGDMMDTHSHGTHVAGTIGAKQNNGVGIAGVASNVAIMGIRTVPNRGDETDVDVSESFIYAAKHGAKVINCSFGKSNNERGMLVKETIDHIGKEYGVLVVAAAGNSSQNIDRRLTYPASFESDNLLVVAATTSRGSMAYFSNYGIKNVDVAAPGSGVYSTTPGNRYSNMSGTSMASPNTAGVAAEVLSRNPQLSVAELKEVLMKTVTKVGKYSSKMKAGGQVNLNEALSNL